MKTIQCFILALVALMSFESTAFSQIITETRTYSPIRMNYQELSELISTVNTAISDINGKSDSHRALITIANDIITLEAVNSLPTTSGTSMPTKATRFKYTYYSRVDDSPISQVSIEFVDYHREVKVQGLDRERIKSLCATIEGSIGNKTTPLGGGGAKIILLLVMVALLISLVAIAVSIKHRHVKIISIAVIITMLILSFTVPWSTVLAGTMITNEGPFYEKWESILAIAAAIFSIVLSLFKLPKVIAELYGKKTNEPATKLSEETKPKDDNVADAKATKKEPE